MKPIKTIAILLGMTFSLGGFSGFISPVLAIYPTRQQSAISTDRMNAESLFERGTEKINPVITKEQLLTLTALSFLTRTILKPIAVGEWRTLV